MVIHRQYITERLEGERYSKGERLGGKEHTGGNWKGVLECNSRSKRELIASH